MSDDDLCVRVGPHTVTFEPPDLVVIVPVGEVSRDDVDGANAVIRRCAERAPHLLLLVRLDRIQGIGPDARKAVARKSAASPLRGIAFCRGSFSTMLLGRLTYYAANLFVKRDNPGYFCATEEEARAWIEQRRRHLAAEKRG